MAPSVPPGDARPSPKPQPIGSLPTLILLTLCVLIFFAILWRRAASIRRVVGHRLKSFTNPTGQIQLPANPTTPASPDSDAFLDDTDDESDSESNPNSHHHAHTSGQGVVTQAEAEAAESTAQRIAGEQEAQFLTGEQEETRRLARAWDSAKAAVSKSGRASGPNPWADENGDGQGPKD